MKKLTLLVVIIAGFNITHAKKRSLKEKIRGIERKEQQTGNKFSIWKIRTLGYPSNASARTTMWDKIYPRKKGKCRYTCPKGIVGLNERANYLLYKFLHKYRRDLLPEYFKKSGNISSIGKKILKIIHIERKRGEKHTLLKISTLGYPTDAKSRKRMFDKIFSHLKGKERYEDGLTQRGNDLLYKALAQIRLTRKKKISSVSKWVSSQLVKTHNLLWQVTSSMHWILFHK